MGKGKDVGTLSRRKGLRKGFAAVCIITGIVILAVPIYWHFKGAWETEQLMQEFEQEIEMDEETEENTGKEKSKNAISKAGAALLSERKVIGIIEIPSLDIRYPVMEGTSSSVLNAGIGHVTETADIGEAGNCVLCGHNGSRYGIFFTPLSQIAIGAEVSVMDKTGAVHLYEVTETFVVNPYDNSIKAQSGEEELTLFTCAERGTKRYVVKCSPKEVNAGDEKIPVR